MKETLLPHKTNSALNLLPLFNEKKTLASLTRALRYLEFDKMNIIQTFLIGHIPIQSKLRLEKIEEN